MWAISCTAYFGFLRLGELLTESADQFNPVTDLAWGDVAVDSNRLPTMLRIHLKKSKTDQFGRGTDVIVGRTGLPLCPVTAMMDYLASRQDFPGPFFVDTSHRAITKAWFVQHLRVFLAKVGLPAHEFAGHSFRIGAATSAALAGIDDSAIQLLGRWKSSAFLRYIQLPKDQLAAIAVKLARPVVPNSITPT